MAKAENRNKGNLRNNTNKLQEINSDIKTNKNNIANKLKNLKGQIMGGTKTITTYVNNGNIKKLRNGVKRIKNNNPMRITELTTSNNTTARNDAQLIITRTEHITDTCNNKADKKHGMDIINYINRNAQTY